ncbi:divergent PAP2 family protein [Undibacterium jejuense]|uniref:Divergent PAP2 family protein n=1 Tax=Undibacterium jejuense TaxID=1344949 RepID=A0A923KRQ7_9BURK|nr:divergent PAP2 family protein [Undibacterium jejuense]MBC3864296.1 divergent PAP2 family protein [Undibacterium jejuense]
MNCIYLITPILAWVVAGTIKLIVNCLHQRRIAFELIGYGGFPSTHSTIVSSSVAQIALQTGITSPLTGLAFTLAFIVLLDAHSLRGQIGKHAVELNCLNRKIPGSPILRERIGHSKAEIATGVLLGCLLAVIVGLSFSTGR